MSLIEKYKKELYEACEKYNVNELYVFGSILTDRFNDDSDIDFIVSIESKDPFEYAENYFELKFELEEILKRQIDLLEQKAINNKTFAKIIEKSKMLVYARRSKGVA